MFLFVCLAILFLLNGIKQDRHVAICTFIRGLINTSNEIFD